MASIPLPALDVRAPQPQDPTAQLGHLMQMKSLMGQQQLQQQEIQGSQLDNQQKQIQLDQSKALMSTAKGIDWTQPDAFGKFLTSAQASGKVNPQTLSAMALQRAQYNEQLAKTDTATLGATKDAQGQLLGHIDAIKGITDPAKRQAAAQDQAGQILGNPTLLKYIPPQVQQGLQAMQQGQHVPSDDELQMIEIGLTDRNTQIEQHLKVAQTGEAEQRAAESAENTKKTQAETAYYQQHGGAPGVSPETMGMNDWLQKNPTKGPADFLKAKATWVPQFNFNMNGGGSQPTSTDPSVLAVAEGRMKIGDVLTPRTPYPVRQQFLKAVQQANPNFDSRNYDVEKGVMRDFTSGDAAKNLTAFNTAIEHANQLSTAADALQNGDMRGLNKIGNSLGYQFGSDKTTNFNVIKNALSGEISKVFKGGQATDAEIREVQGPFDAANSPQQLKGAITNAVALMNSKRDALKQQYQSGVQAKPNFGGTAQHVAGGAAQGLKEGQTGTGSDGKKYVVKNGTWQAQQ